MLRATSGPWVCPLNADHASDAHHLNAKQKEKEGRAPCSERFCLVLLNVHHSGWGCPKWGCRRQWGSNSKAEQSQGWAETFQLNEQTQSSRFWYWSTFQDQTSKKRSPSNPIPEPKSSTLLCMTCRKQGHYHLSNHRPQHTGEKKASDLVLADTLNCSIGSNIRHETFVLSYPQILWLAKLLYC